MSEQLTLNGEPAAFTKELRVYCVDEHDYYAASTPLEAIECHIVMFGGHPDDVEDSGCECEEVTGEWLDKPWNNEDGEYLGTLREWLAEAKGVEWLTGTE